MLRLSENYPLQSLNTFGINAYARYFAEMETAEEIQEFLKENKNKSLPLFILGGGSNILLMNDFNGIALKINLLGKKIVKQENDHVFVKTGAGENWDQLVQYCIDNNFGGVENLSLIPGCVGAAPMQNIGAYGVELKDIFHELEAIMIESGETILFTNQDCRFGYRESIFKNELKGKCIIISVTLKLSKNPRLNTSYGAIEEELKKMNVKDITIRAVSQAVCHIRKSKLPDPALIGNAGSFFKNPTVSQEKFQDLKLRFPDLVAYPQPNDTDEKNEAMKWKIAAGWLIEKAGWKGKRFNGYGVHEKQALVLVNYGGAKGSDIYNLSQTIMNDINDKYGLMLEREVNIVG